MLKRRLNAQSVTHRLPSEVLGRIFWFALPESWATPGLFERYLAVVRLCSFWRDTALTCPYLWSTLPAGSVVRSSALLSLSNGALLTLDIPPDFRMESVGSASISELSRVLQQSSRIRSMRIPTGLSSSVDKQLRDWVRGPPTQSLKTLEIYDHPSHISEDMTTPPFDGFYSVAPDMQEFTCHGGSMDVTTLAWKHLKSLCLFDIGIPATMSQLLEAFSSITSLRTLKLRIIAISNDVDNAKTMTLPSLELLHILPGMDPDLAVHLVKHIRAPRVSELRVGGPVSVFTVEDVRILGHSSLLSDYAAASGRALNSVYVRVDPIYSDSMISARTEGTTSLDISPEVQVLDTGMLFFWAKYDCTRGHPSETEGRRGVHRIMMEIAHSLQPQCLSLELDEASIGYACGGGLFPFKARPEHETIEPVDLALVGHPTVSNVILRLDSVVPIGILRLSTANLGEPTEGDYVLRDVLKAQLAARAARGQPIRQLEVRECAYFGEEDCAELISQGWVVEKAWITEANHPLLDQEFSSDTEDTSESDDAWSTTSSSGEESSSVEELYISADEWDDIW
jgi:hypothetical protein